MFNGSEFEDYSGVKRTRAGDVAGGIGAWGLHVAAVLFMVYSGYHGISASAAYRSAAGLGQLAGIVGIIVIEIVLLAIYLSWHNGRIVGAAQSVAAGVTFGIGFILACLGIVADSQLQAGIALSPWLEAYLVWGLPLAPAVMALGAVIIHETAPAQARARRETEDRDQVEEARFNGYLDGIKSEIMAARSVATMQQMARQQSAKQIAAWYSSDEAQRAIMASALKDAPRVLRQIGIDVDPGDMVEVKPSGKPAAAPVYSANGSGGAANGRGMFHDEA